MKFKSFSLTRFVCFIAVACGLVFSGCATKTYDSHVPPAKKKYSGKSPATQRPYTIKGKQYVPLASASGYVEKGRASWYGKKFHGRKTSNGETYNMYAMTAAHKTLPMNTWVRVENLENGKQIKVRVNDRGPFVSGRIIDLSYTGAKQIGMVGPGTARVRVLPARSRWCGMTAAADRAEVERTLAELVSRLLTTVYQATRNSSRQTRAAAAGLLREILPACA